MRKPYLDNLRWATVLLVVVYHVCWYFNGIGTWGSVPGAKSLPAGNALLYAVYPWFMVLLFVIAGMSARYALETRSPRQFFRDRTRKLLVPSTIGLLVFQWLGGLLNIYAGGGLEWLPPALVYPVAVLSGIGPLWFIQMLWLFSILLLGLRRLDPNDRVWNACTRLCRAPVLLAWALLLWAAAQVGNTPIIVVYRFGIYGAAFLTGYYLLSHEEAQTCIQSMRLPMAAAALVGCVFYTRYYYGTDYVLPSCLQSLWTALYLWAAVLALLGCARAYWNVETPFTRRMSRASFGLYALHCPVLLAVCLLLCGLFDLPAAVNYLLALALTLPLTSALAALIARTPFLRWAVLGIKAEK